MRRIESVLVILTIIILIAAWVYGAVTENIRLKEAISKSLPESQNIQNSGIGLYISKETGDIISIASSTGFGGPLQVATSVNIEGSITGISIISNKETRPFFIKLKDANYPDTLLGKHYSSKFQPGKDVDSVSGATLSLAALTTAVRKGAIKAAVEGFKLKTVDEPSTPMLIGFKEILLLLLFITGLLNYSKLIGLKLKKYFRWGTLLMGMIFLGFIYTVPLSIINVNSFLMGYWPEWHSHIFWYLLLLCVFLPLIIIGKSPYCDSFCPFGSAQEILKLTGGITKKIPYKVTKALHILQKILALSLIFTALIFRDPGYGNYEVFGTFFSLTGNTLQYALMAVIVLTSLFFARPWCNYLCPLKAVSDFIKTIRKMILTKISKPYIKS